MMVKNTEIKLVGQPILKQEWNLVDSGVLKRRSIIKRRKLRINKPVS